MSDQSEEPARPRPEYLGDGVYARFDGYQIWLAANDHRNDVIAIEPAVLSALIQYAKHINRVCEVDHFAAVGEHP